LHSSASLKVKEPLLGGGTSIQTNEYSPLLNAFKNNLLPWFTNHAKKTDTDHVEFSTDQETEQSSNIHSSSMPVDHGYGTESSYSYLSASADQEHEESSNIHSSSTPVDHGYGKELSYSYLSASADQEHKESSNIHSSSTPGRTGFGGRF
jgi:hypothetical protein